MGWMIDTRDMSRVVDFRMAEEVWNDATPWRNEHSSWRQLGGRRAVHKRIVKYSTGGYGCVLYQTPMVTYFPDGAVELRCYGSASSNMFAWMVKPQGCAPVNHQQTMFWAVDTPEGERFYTEGNGPLRFIPDGRKWRLTSQPAQPTEWKYDPKLGAEVRRKLKPFKQWADLTLRLTGEKIPQRHWAKGSQYDAGFFLVHSNETEYYPKILELFGCAEWLKDAAYLAAGARTLVDAPFDRLPRKKR